MCDYSQELTCEEAVEEWDIMEVYFSKTFSNLKELLKNATLIWERKEKTELELKIEESNNRVYNLRYEEKELADEFKSRSDRINNEIRKLTTESLEFNKQKIMKGGF